jgi:hypothetical protein
MARDLLLCSLQQDRDLRRQEAEQDRQVRPLPKECHKADHALDKSANCKAIGAKIQDFGARFNQCDKCKAAFAKFLKSAHYYADFEPCSVCIWEPVQPVD